MALVPSSRGHIGLELVVVAVFLIVDLATRQDTGTRDIKVAARD